MHDPAANIAPTKINNKYCPPNALLRIVAAHPPQKRDMTNPLRNAVKNPVIAPAIAADTKSSLINPKPIPTNATPIGKLAQFIFRKRAMTPIIKATIVAMIAKIIIPPPASSAIIFHLKVCYKFVFNV